MHRFIFPMKVPFQEGLTCYSRPFWKKKWMIVLYKDVNVRMEPLQKHELEGFSINIRELFEGKCELVLVRY